MPARDETALKEYVRASVRRVVWMREILRSLGINVASGDLGKTGQAGLAACRAELLRIAATHPVYLSLAIDAWELVPDSGGDDDEDEGGEDEAAGVHPQAPLLPARAEDSLYEQFPTIGELPDLKWLPVSDEYAPAGGEPPAIETDAVGLQLAKALEQITALQKAQDDLESSFERRARAQAVQLFKDSNAGVAESPAASAMRPQPFLFMMNSLWARCKGTYDTTTFVPSPWQRDVRYDNLCYGGRLRVHPVQLRYARR